MSFRIHKLPLLKRKLRRDINLSIYFVHTNATDETMVFDNRFKNMQRDGAARSYKLWNSASSDPVDYDYFHREISHRLVDRLDDMKREQGFPLALDIGSGSGQIFQIISSQDLLQDDIGGGFFGGIQKLVQIDSSLEMLHRDDDDDDDANSDTGLIKNAVPCQRYKLKWDDEKRLPFPDSTFDLVLSCASLHRINHLPMLFSEIKRVLKPDGCFLASMIGGSSLPELRAVLLLAESERDGGVSPRVGPFVDVADVGRLLSGAGFALPTVDVDTIRFSFPNAFVLMEHIQRMGESNACMQRKQTRTSVDTFLAAACLYEDMFALSFEEAQGGVEIEATVQVIYCIGWVPHESQQKPKVRGSATRRIGDVVGEKEKEIQKEST